MKAWLHRQYTFWSADFISGLAVSAVVGLVAAMDETVRRSARPILIAAATLGVALLAVALTALAILVAFLGENYVKLLRESIGIPAAFRPYKTIARVGCALTIVAGVAAFAWPHMHWLARTFGLAISAGLAIWALVGTVQLVSITAGHGERRARMPEIREAAQAALEKRRNKGAL